MMKKSCAVILLAALFQLAGVREQIEDIQFTSSEDRAAKVIAPDTLAGEAIYLFSKTGIPYRCFLRLSEGFPLNCRQAQGDEVEQALKEIQFEPQFNNQRRGR